MDKLMADFQKWLAAQPGVTDVDFVGQQRGEWFLGCRVNEVDVSISFGYTQ